MPQTRLNFLGHDRERSLLAAWPSRLSRVCSALEWALVVERAGSLMAVDAGTKPESASFEQARPGDVLRTTQYRLGRLMAALERLVKEKGSEWGGEGKHRQNRKMLSGWV